MLPRVGDPLAGLRQRFARAAESGYMTAPPMPFGGQRPPPFQGPGPLPSLPPSPLSPAEISQALQNQPVMGLQNSATGSMRPPPELFRAMVERGLLPTAERGAVSGSADTFVRSGIQQAGRAAPLVSQRDIIAALLGAGGVAAGSAAKQAFGSSEQAAPGMMGSALGGIIDRVRGLDLRRGPGR